MGSTLGANRWGRPYLVQHGISLPGSGENPAAPVFIDGVKVKTLRGEHIAQDFQQIVSDYVTRTYGKRETAQAETL